MRIFLTGATGFVGSAIVQELLAAGHEVTGLARSEEAATALRQAGAEAHFGSLDDLDGLARGAAASDGVIHTAFVHDFSDYAGAGRKDQAVVRTLADSLAGSDRPLVITSVTALLPAGRLATEADAPDPASASAIRIPSEQVLTEAAARRVRTAAVRLPPSVHGDGDHAFVPTLIGIARAKGVSAAIGNGANRWPAVHRLDAARLYRLAVESAPADARLHAVADEGIRFGDIAALIGRRLNLPVASVPAEQADGHFGWLAHFAAIDNPTSSAWTQELLGWRPTRPGLLADMDRDAYFALEPEAA